jgi:2-oxoacid dehydrogenases acyltransferase (catalytic domain)
VAGRRIRMPPLRRVLLDLLHFSKKMPLVTAERRMALGPLSGARQACATKPSWSAIFMKAFALVAQRRPELRRVYCSFPWAHFYEHDESVGYLTVERELAGEPVVVFGRCRAPDRQSLSELTNCVRAYQERPVESMKTFQRMRRTAYLPTFLRRLLWNYARLVGGRSWINNFGTFGLSSTAAHGAGLAAILSITTSTLHYGLFDADGNLDFRLTFDHRVYDGAFAARVLTEMEATLLRDILAEVRSMPSTSLAA